LPTGELDDDDGVDLLVLALVVFANNKQEAATKKPQYLYIVILGCLAC